MGLISFLKRLLLGSPPAPGPSSADGSTASNAEPAAATPHRPSPGSVAKIRRPVRLPPLKYRVPYRDSSDYREAPPYQFARKHPATGRYLDSSGDHDADRLAAFGLPDLRTPEDLAHWLKIPVKKLAWLTGRFFVNERPQSVPESHYHYHWVKKKTSGYRLIEAPKSSLKAIQNQILREVLDLVPAHSAAHGFVKHRSIRTNAAPHVGQAWVLKLDLENFYPSVRFNRVVAIFHALGYCREVSQWLGRLTTAVIPSNLNSPDQLSSTVWPYQQRHLPQGAPTSPALANLSAFALDVRLQGLANRYHVRYTRYADDLTLSGNGKTTPALRELIPLMQRIVTSERFTVNKKKRRVLRRHQQQNVTGLVVNQKLNLCRAEFDTLKAILTNCIRQGPASQNHGGHDDFASHLRGRIGHWLSVHPARGQKLLGLFQSIDWSR